MDWAAGFLDAIELRRTKWEPLFRHRRARLLLELLLTLGADSEFDDEREPGERWKEFYASRPDVVPNCVLGVFKFWKDQQERKRPKPRRDRRARR
jgi:hypothetical protein